MPQYGLNHTLVSSIGNEPYVSAPTDANSEQFGLWVNGKNLLFNGATCDRQRGNTEGTLLASAARTTSVSSAAQTNYNARGVIITVRVTSAGTGTLRVLIASNDPASGLGAWYPLDSATGTSANVSAVGVSPYFLYPGAGAVTDTLVVKKAVSLPLPRYWLVEVIPSDASSWTYSIGYSLIV